MRFAERLPAASTRQTGLTSARPSGPLQEQVDASALVQRLREQQELVDRSAIVQQAGGLARIRDAVSQLSGQDLRDVAIHRDSPLPMHKGALAFAT
ncbi:MAG: hypothetical protein HC927_09505, partial [Deltaproteobacteria bacterium]|nr:hypothetical protein [Deltaproteobacteria bacterium]